MFLSLEYFLHKGRRHSLSQDPPYDRNWTNVNRNKVLFLSTTFSKDGVSWCRLQYRGLWVVLIRYTVRSHTSSRGPNYLLTEFYGVILQQQQQQQLKHVSNHISIWKLKTLLESFLCITKEVTIRSDHLLRVQIL